MFRRASTPKPRAGMSGAKVAIDVHLTQGWWGGSEVGGRAWRALTPTTNTVCVYRLQKNQRNHIQCQHTGISFSNVQHLTWRAVPETPVSLAHNSIPVPVLKKPSERNSFPVLVLLDDQLKCQAILHQAHRSTKARSKHWPGPSLLASFSPPDTNDFAGDR